VSARRSANNLRVKPGLGESVRLDVRAPGTFVRPGLADLVRTGRVVSPAAMHVLTRQGDHPLHDRKVYFRRR
jgi:hypothetical protein